MGALGKGKANLTANVTARVRAFVALRGKANEWTASKMAGHVVQYWLNAGAPAVIPHERGAQVLSWDPAVKWELLAEGDAVPGGAELPRDQPLARLRR